MQVFEVFHSEISLSLSTCVDLHGESGKDKLLTPVFVLYLLQEELSFQQVFIKC